MCREIVSLTAWGATYCREPEGSDGFCVVHRRVRAHPLPDALAGRVAAAMGELSEVVRRQLVEDGMDPVEAEGWQVSFDLSLTRDPPQP